MENEALKPKLTKTEKLDATTDAAYEIIDRQVSEREKKTAPQGDASSTRCRGNSPGFTAES